MTWFDDFAVEDHGQHRTLTATKLNTFLPADDLTNALLSEWAPIPIETLQNCQKSGAYPSSKW